MAFTSTKMGLRVWNLLTDLYDHAQLADNWAKVDYHDHSPGKGVQIPTEGLADGAVTDAKLASSLDPTGAYTGHRVVATFDGTFPGSNGAATYPIPFAGVAGNISGLPGINANLIAFYLDPDDWAATGRTVKYFLRGSVITNAVAPTSNYAFSLLPVATWGGTSGTAPNVQTLGAAVAGSTTTSINTPAASAPAGPTISEFSAPAAGWYVVGVTQTGASIANSNTAVQARLSVRQV